MKATTLWKENNLGSVALYVKRQDTKFFIRVEAYLRQDSKWKLNIYMRKREKFAVLEHLLRGTFEILVSSQQEIRSLILDA